MVNKVNESIDKYFTHLSNTGYRKQRDVNKLLLYNYIQELLDNDFRGLVSIDDYKHINNALYCLYGTTCLIPFPDYYNNKNKQIMYTGSMSEMSNRVQRAEEQLAKINKLLQGTDDEAFVISGTEIKEIEDFNIEL